MLVRVTKTVRDRGALVHPDEVEKFVENREIDWYCSPFFYGEGALEYWKEHGESIKGFTGEAWTDTLYWDLDCKEDFDKVQHNALRLLEYISNNLNMGEGLEVYFSGNKGVHVFLRTKNKFTPQETSAICYNIAIKAGVDKDVFDTTVYNVNRIFRIVNTKHQESGLYKIILKDEEILHMTEDEIRGLAENPRDLEPVSELVDASKLLKELSKKKKAQENVVSLQSILESKVEDDEDPDDFDARNCPNGKRRCIYVLENGYFGPGERENALIRIAAYYKGRNLTYEQNYAILNKALERRAAIYTDASPFKDEDTHRILKEVYSEGWRGGTYSCRSTIESPDVYLQSKCDLGDGPCGDEKVTVNAVSVVDIAGLLQIYNDYGAEALKEYPKTGNPWMDKKIRIRPRNFSLINGANGSGKTSLMNNIIDSLNQQKIYHLVFSLDMADTSLLEKLAATHTDYNQEEIEAAFNVHTRNEKIVAEVAKVLMQKLPYTMFDFTSSADARHLESTVQRLKKEKQVDIRVVFVDYAGRLIGDHDNEFANSSQNALMANDIAKRTGAHFIYLSQISRENGDHCKPLRTSRIAKHSGAWEENATFILNVWRPFGNGLDGNDNYMHVYIAKNRSGPLGEHVLWWEGKSGVLREMTPEEFSEYRGLCEQYDLEPPYEQFAEERAKKAKRHPSFNYEDPDEEVSGDKLEREAAAPEETDEEELSNSPRPNRFRKDS